MDSMGSGGGEFVVANGGVGAGVVAEIRPGLGVVGLVAMAGGEERRR